MKIINLTPHTLNIQAADGSMIAIAPSGQVARVSSTSTVVDSVAGIDIHDVVFGDIVGLPDLQIGKVFVVSGLVLSALKGSRVDVFAPGDLIRGADGQPIGCKGLRK